MAVITETKVFTPTGYNTERSSFYSISGATNFVGQDTESTKKATVYLNRGSGAETFFFMTFDCSSIPQNATVTSVSGKIKGRCSGSANYISLRQVRPYLGDTARGYSITLTNADQVLDMNLGTGAYTPEGLYQMEYRWYAKRSSSSTGSSLYFYVYGAELTVTYEYEQEESSKFYLKENGDWVTVDGVYKKTNGLLVEQTDPLDVFERDKLYITKEYE